MKASKSLGGDIMKNKIWVIALLFVALLAIPMVAFAENADTNTISDDTINEMRIMGDPLGAHVRLLQLEKSLTRNVLSGQAVLDVIAKNHPDTNTVSAGATLDSLEMLTGELKTIIENADTNTSVQKFVEIKKEGITLTQQFREQTRDILTATDKQEIRDKVAEIDKNELKTISDQTEHVKNQFNADKVEALLKLMNVSNPELIQRITDGNATKQEVEDAVTAAYNALTPEQKTTVDSLIKENSIKRTISEKEAIKKGGEGLGNRMLQRAQNQIQKLSDWYQQRAIDANANGHPQREQRMQELSDKLGQISDRLDNNLRNHRGGR
ncbi:Uncharacterised protein [uncultured archaeon]|nr:Uncharacterised protein [uncultured archaeon]